MTPHQPNTKRPIVTPVFWSAPTSPSSKLTPLSNVKASGSVLKRPCTWIVSIFWRSRPREKTLFAWLTSWEMNGFERKVMEVVDGTWCSGFQVGDFCWFHLDFQGRLCDWHQKKIRVDKDAVPFPEGERISGFYHRFWGCKVRKCTPAGSHVPRHIFNQCTFRNDVLHKFQHGKV